MHSRIHIRRIINGHVVSIAWVDSNCAPRTARLLAERFAEEGIELPRATSTSNSPLGSVGMLPDTEPEQSDRGGCLPPTIAADLVHSAEVAA